MHMPISLHYSQVHKPPKTLVSEPSFISCLLHILSQVEEYFSIFLKLLKDLQKPNDLTENFPFRCKLSICKTKHNTYTFLLLHFQAAGRRDKLILNPLPAPADPNLAAKPDSAKHLAREDQTHSMVGPS